MRRRCLPVAETRVSAPLLRTEGKGSEARQLAVDGEPQLGDMCCPCQALIQAQA